jgi:hypothetical protein
MICSITNHILIERVDVGISPHEMRFVIAEADENENGVVDFHEFVPLGKAICHYEAVDDAVYVLYLFYSPLKLWI